MSTPTPAMRCTGFAGDRRFASGDCRTVAAAARSLLDADPSASLLIFDDMTARQVELDLRGTVEEVLERLRDAPQADDASHTPRSPGRPKLGVVAREVTLLPRHWEWLASQPGGASAALRRLVEEARKVNAHADRVREGRDVTYRFMNAVAGNEPGFEDAVRALYAGDRESFDRLSASWPPDVREYASQLSAECW